MAPEIPREKRKKSPRTIPQLDQIYSPEQDYYCMHVLCTPHSTPRGGAALEFCPYSLFAGAVRHDHVYPTSELSRLVSLVYDERSMYVHCTVVYCYCKPPYLLFGPGFSYTRRSTRWWAVQYISMLCSISSCGPYLTICALRDDHQRPRQYRMSKLSRVQKDCGEIIGIVHRLTIRMNYEVCATVHYCGRASNPLLQPYPMFSRMLARYAVGGR